MKTVTEYRLAWLEEAIGEWSTCVRDDDKGEAGDRDVITGYFEECGWLPFLARVGGTYRETSSTSWCGMFQGAMGARVGLDLDVAKFCMPSTSRLASRSKWQAAGVPSPTTYAIAGMARQFRNLSSNRLTDARDVLLPGVLATVRTSGKKPAIGDHIVIVEKYDENDGMVSTVEGNGRGQLGDGTRGEGVIRCERKLEDFVRVYHFDLAHFEDLEGDA